MIEKLKVFDATTGDTVFEVGGHRGNILAVAWNREGTRIASGGVDKLVRIWDAGTGRLVNTLYGHIGFIGSVEWNPQRDLLATASSDGTIRIWG
jgi:WD40 repeat protein